MLWLTGCWGLVWHLVQETVSWTWPAAMIGVGLYFAGESLVRLPLQFASSFIVVRRFGLSRQRAGHWFGDWAKGTILALLVGVTAILVLFWLWLSSGPHWWWLYGLALSAGLALLSFFAPYVLVPLFYRQTSVEDVALVSRLRALLDRVGVRASQICRLDFSRRTVEANAAVIGLGPSRRIVISDTLLQAFEPAEVVSVVAHELGHHVRRDLLRLLAAESLIMVAGLLVAEALGLPRLVSASSGQLPLLVASLPLVLLAAEAYRLCTLPVINALSRAIESAADRYALAATGDGRAFASAMRRLARQNLVEEHPPRWAVWLYHTHPPLAERVALAESWPAGARQGGCAGHAVRRRWLSRLPR